MTAKRRNNKYDLDAVLLAGPGHGAPDVLAPLYLERTYSIEQWTWPL